MCDLIEPEVLNEFSFINIRVFLPGKEMLCILDTHGFPHSSFVYAKKDVGDRAS